MRWIGDTDARKAAGAEHTVGKHVGCNATASRDRQPTARVRQKGSSSKVIRHTLRSSSESRGLVTETIQDERMSIES